jgi:IS5 family transposase
MQRAVAWSLLEALIAPHYPKAGGGRRPHPLATMLRIHCPRSGTGRAIRRWREELYEIASMRQFVGLWLARGAVPDETILNFRHLLERHSLAQKIFDTVKAHLQTAGLSLRQGTIVDATIIAAPRSTKNSRGERDPEMHQTRKGNQWYFGMKAHVGVDAESSLVHSVIGTAANVADVTQAHELLHGGETVAFGDAGYIGIEQRPERKNSGSSGMSR